ncbi:hypothetical protein Hdeb2414_s0001g00028561 [Helianthus debilis subsp. tardiflorus]
MGFSPRWCNWIMGILKSASSSVLVNEAPTFTFKCEKGGVCCPIFLCWESK